MKLTAIFILAACLHVSAKTEGQTVTITLKDAPLKEVFREIQKQTGMNIMVRESLLKKAEKVSLQVKDMAVDEVLIICLQNQPLDFIIENGIIVIHQKLNSNNTSSNKSKAPPIDVTGKVTDEEGNPLIGATVKVKGSNAGTTTDLNGVFVLRGVNEDAVLEISYTEHQTVAVELKGRTSLMVSMRPAVARLQEVVVNKGYYSEKQRLSVSNVVKVVAKDIEKQPVNNPLLALQGRVPGLLITQNTGIPGGGITVQIQGRNNLSLVSGSDPLYVIDGVPYTSQMFSSFTGGPTGNILSNSGGPVGSGAGNPLSFINPADIESVEVLMDADATAIYGSRAANGAILITTKKGKTGPFKINIDLQNGWGKVGNKIDLLNTQEYVHMRREAFNNDNIVPTISNAPDLLLWDTTRYTDWQEKLIGNTAQFTQLTAGISGGNLNTNYLISGTFQRQTSVFPGDFEDRKGSAHFNINGNSPNQRMNVQLTGSFLFDKNELPANEFTTQAIRLAPNAPAIYKADGTLNWEHIPGGSFTFFNPYSGLTRTYDNKVYNLVSNAIIGYNIFPFLSVKSSFGYTYLQANEFQAFPTSGLPPEYVAIATRYSWHTNSNINSWIAEPQINYFDELPIGKIDFLIGSTIQQRNGSGFQIEGSGYNSDQVMRDLQSAPNVNVNFSDFSTYKYNAIYSRLNYNWNDKYILNLTARRDGSSRYGSKNQFHNFWSIGGAWLFSEESAIRKKFDFLSFGKIRGNYGTTGNDQIGDYRFMNLYTQIFSGYPYQGTNGLEPTGLSNPYYQWEETKKLQVGMDLGFLDDRINLSGTYIRNESSNHLLDYILSRNTGFGGILLNFPATIRNSAWQVSLNTVNVDLKKMKWSTAINLTIPKNKLVDFPNYSSTSYASGEFGVIPGYPLGITKAYRYLGINPATGLYEVEDINGNPTSQPTGADRKVLINTQSKYYGGLNNSLSFQNFEFSFFLQYMNQTGIPFLINGVPGAYYSGEGNQPKIVLTRWQKPGDITNIRAYSTDMGTDFSGLGGSDFVYQDASFLRVKNLSLSWQMPTALKNKIKIQDLKIYVHGQNLFTVTDYQGLDPENRSSLNLPPLKIYTIGLQVGL